MPPSQNRFDSAALIQALECELGRQSETEPSEIYDVYIASRKETLQEIVGKLRQVSRKNEPVFWMNFGSALITRIEERTAYSRQLLAPAVRTSVFGELSGLRSALRIFRRALNEQGLQGKKVG